MSVCLSAGRNILIYIYDLSIVTNVDIPAFLSCLGEQLSDQTGKEEHTELPHFDSVILSGPPLNNIQQVDQNADVMQSKNNHSLPMQPSRNPLHKGLSNNHSLPIQASRNPSLQGRLSNNAKTSNKTGPIKKVQINITKDQNEQDILPALQQNPLIQKLLNAGPKFANEVNMTIYVIKQNKDSKLAPFNTSKLHQDTKNLTKPLSNEGFNRSRNNTSRKHVPQNITVFLDTPESVESIPKAPPSNDSLNLTTIMKGQQMMENIHKTWSWNQRTGSRWPSRRVRNRWRRPSRGRRPTSGGQFGGRRPGQGGWTRPSQGGNQVSRPRPNQGGTGGQPSGVGNSGGSSTSQGT